MQVGRARGLPAPVVVEVHPRAIGQLSGRKGPQLGGHIHHPGIGQVAQVAQQAQVQGHAQPTGGPAKGGHECEVHFAQVKVLAQVALGDDGRQLLVTLALGLGQKVNGHGSAGRLEIRWFSWEGIFSLCLL